MSRLFGKDSKGFAKKFTAFGLLVAMMVCLAVPAMASPINSNAAAEQVALRLYPEATVLKTEFEHKRNGSSYYEVRLEQDGVRVDVKVDAASGTIRQGYNQNLFNLATITPTQARTTARNLYPGSTVRYIELDYEKGVLVYDVELTQANGRKAEVYVNGTTGEVIRNRAR